MRAAKSEEYIPLREREQGDDVMTSSSCASDCVLDICVCVIRSGRHE